MTGKASKPTIKIVLTAEQKEWVRQLTGREIASLQSEELEERVAPRVRAIGPED